ncbi:leucine-rich repeat and WD repeat-containing protein 1-like isoform X2 [Periplaneta americana]|uniref:leucine-rich repeat and WD repeat-containing protein 1-like isoform X2 n=1 Tax=Periplaneta americana TaxID=6978 RepID=UPI0037E8761A
MSLTTWHSVPDIVSCVAALREMFYSVAWTTLLVESGDPPQINVLAAAGARNTLHLIHPEGGVAFHEHQFLRSKRVNVSSLMFHPKQGNILFCAMGDGQVLTWNVGSPAPPNYETQLNLLLTLEARSEIFSLVFSSHLDILLAASNTGVCGWVVTQDMLRKKPNNVAMLKFNFPKRRGNTTRTSEPQLVDSIEMVGQSTVATKCALHGVIYLWNLTSAIQGDAVTTVQPTHVLQWSDTDNYFMNMGCHPVAGLLACGDDMGALWLYDLSNILQQPAQDKRVAPSTILDWPDVEDSHVDRNRKLRLGVYDIVVDKVAVSSNGRYLVAVTSNNMVCIWKRTK